MTHAGIHVTAVEDDGRSESRLATSAHELLPLADVLTDALRDSAAVAENDVPQLEEFAEGWGRSLIPEAVLETPPEILVIVPHGVLHGVPLHLVRTARGEPLACAAGVTYAGSMSSYCRSAMLNRDRNGRGTRRRAAGGGVDVRRDDAAYGALAAEVLARFGGESEHGSRYAAKDALESQDVDVVCLVAHGYLDTHEHRSSGLLLDQDVFTRSRGLPLYGGHLVYWDVALSDFPAVAHRRSSDFLTLRELETMASRAELTLLLACSAGTARVLQTDEPASLADALTRAGSASVIAPMWESRLDVTVSWVREFLLAWLERSQPKALAARDAFRSLDAGSVADLGPLHMRGDWL